MKNVLTHTLKVFTQAPQFSGGVVSLTIPFNPIIHCGDYVKFSSNFSSTSYAASSDFKIKNGVLTKYTGKSSKITIPSSVKTIGDNAFKGNRYIKTIKIPSSVKTIGKYAFAFSSLSSVTISNGVTTIKDHAFFCTELK